MVEDLELGKGVKLKKEGKRFMISCHPAMGIASYNLSLNDIEKLKKWLEEATKSRFYIKTTYAEFAVHDREMGNEIVARFYNFTKGFDAKAEAERLCKKLNEGSDR